MGACFPNLERLEFCGGELALLDVSDLPQLTSINAADEPPASLVSVLATPRVQPDLEPYAQPGTSMIITG